MTLQAFSFPLPETRFIKAGSFIYKFKIRGGSSYSGEEDMGGNCFSQELEEIIRTVLGNLDSLQPFSSTHFNVFPHKKKWEGVSNVMCKHYERKLRVYPFILILYLEKNTQNGKQAEERFSLREVAQQIPSASEPQSKRRKRDSTLEDAILKELMKDLEAVGKVSVRLHVDNPHTEEEVEDDPGHADKNKTEYNNKPQRKSGVNTLRGSGTPGEAHPGTVQDMDEEEGENADSAKPGILTRLARNVFPFSLLFRGP
ncbi:uncharacterized protein [Pagrus major]|uniref:uncharacterized protein isoform X2 n=1 Tax=Pagrus major TaxID=143350 RepID=UPI003CC86F39